MKPLQLTTLCQWAPAAPRVLAPLLVLVLAWQLAQLTWLLVWPSRHEAAMLAPAATSTGTAQPRVDHARAIAERHVFGEAAVAATSAVVDAPETQLNLKLLGVFAAQGEAGGIAIIAAGGRDEQVYAVNDPLPGGAILKQVLNDRVMLERGGRLETLRLPEERPSLLTYEETPGGGGRPLAPVGPQNVGEALQSLRERAIRDPSQLAELVSVEPVQDANGFAGYRITPKTDDPLFAQIGLQPGDIVTEVNGVKIENAQQGMAVLRRLINARELNLTVMRDGQPVQLQQQIGG